MPYDDILLGGDLTVIRSNLDGAFLSNQINHARKYDIARIAQGKSIVHLHADELKKIYISYPEIEEQRKISGFIDKIDERIATQNKIISKYKTLIKGIREKIANSNWKWIKLNDLIKNGIVTLKRGNIIPKHSQDMTYAYPVYSSSTQNNGLFGIVFVQLLLHKSAKGKFDFRYSRCSRRFCIIYFRKFFG